MSHPQQLIKKYTAIKTLPHVVTRLSKLINNENSTMKDFEDVIKTDPTLVVRLLRMVNSPFFGIRQPVDSISRAVAYIGMKNLQNIAVTDALKNIFKEERKSDVFSRKRLWLHCAAVSICSLMVAERIFGIDGDDAYLCGILHDFGLIVEEQVAEKPFLEACRACGATGSLPAYERQFLDTDHCEVGYLLTQDWGMPSAIQEAIRDHHTAAEDTDPTSLTGILQISEYIVGQFDYTPISGAKPQLSPSLTAHLQDNIDEFAVLIDDFPDEMRKTMEIYGS
ncbi:MAG: HDOD domain-containing protein [Desulfocapsaceae bacterium]|nr:HDOD domain-containing protein [Desulfocapsaceae bacterium]